MTNLRAHLKRVDRGYVALHTAGVTLGTLIAVWFATGDRYGLTTAENWAWTTAVAAGATVAFNSLVFAVIGIARPGVLPQDIGSRYEKRITRLTAAVASLRERVGQLVHENNDLEAENANLSAVIELMDEDNTRLTNERDDARAERDAAGAERDELIDDSPTPDSPYVSDAVTTFNQRARDAFLAMGPPPGYGEHAAELDEEIHAQLSTPPPGWQQDTETAEETK